MSGDMYHFRNVVCPTHRKLHVHRLFEQADRTLSRYFMAAHLTWVGPNWLAFRQIYLEHSCCVYLHRPHMWNNILHKVSNRWQQMGQMAFTFFFFCYFKLDRNVILYAITWGNGLFTQSVHNNNFPFSKQLRVVASTIKSSWDAIAYMPTVTFDKEKYRTTWEVFYPQIV